jgi:hypothetical protein
MRQGLRRSEDVIRRRRLRERWTGVGRDVLRFRGGRYSLRLRLVSNHVRKAGEETYL